MTFRGDKVPPNSLHFPAMNLIRLFLVLSVVWMGSNTLAAGLKVAKQLDQRTAETIQQVAQLDP